jgi:hypothetical protein
MAAGLAEPPCATGVAVPGKDPGHPCVRRPPTGVTGLEWNPLPGPPVVNSGLGDKGGKEGWEHEGGSASAG